MKLTALLLVCVVAADTKKPAPTFFHFGRTDYKDAAGAITDYKFPTYQALFKDGLGADSDLVTETKYEKNALKKTHQKLRQHLRSAWAWDFKKFDKLHRKFDKAIENMRSSFKGTTCKKGKNTEVQMMNSCLYGHLLLLSGAIENVVGGCIEKKKDGTLTSHETTDEKSGCWVNVVHALPTNLAGCCHDKLESKHHCEADAKPIYKMELKLMSDFEKCTGWHHTKGDPKSHTKAKWEPTSNKPNPKFCNKAAQQLMYLSLDVKDWYMKNSAKSGGMSAQCEEDNDDDWINSGDLG
jgi:hypothetical protein